MGCIVQKVLFDVNTPSIRLTCLQLRRLITHHTPRLPTVDRSTKGQMNRPKLLLGDRNMLPAERPAWSQRPPIHLAVTLPLAMDLKTLVNPKAPMST